jgi:hypothetical protein
MFVSKPGSSAMYEAPASADEGSIEASLGAVGRIDVHYVPTGGVETQRTKCGGGPISFLAGRYEGTIEFAGDARPFLKLLCFGGPRSEGIGGHSPGARLQVRHRGRIKFEFEAQANSHSRPAYFSASITELRGPMAISRSVAEIGPPQRLLAGEKSTLVSTFSWHARESRHSLARR